MNDNSKFESDLRALLNKHSMENDSHTPDFILAKYLIECLEAFNKIAKRRDQWWGNEKTICEEVK